MLQTINKLKSAVSLIVEAWTHHHKDNLETQIKLKFWKNCLVPILDADPEKIEVGE
jgi:hypothetical protein